MEFLTATTIFLASLNVYGECGFAYNAETSEDGIVAAKTVYRKSVCGKYLSPTLKYNYVYDGEQRLAQKEVLKWNGVTGKWEKSHILNYLYDENGYTIESMPYGTVANRNTLMWLPSRLTMKALTVHFVSLCINGMITGTTG